MRHLPRVYRFPVFNLLNLTLFFTSTITTYSNSINKIILSPLQDLVGEALVRLGYSSDLIPSARGSIVIRNWKPLPMEKVADGPLLTVGDILAELTSVATLKIQVYRSRPPPPSPAAEVRNKLLRLLLLHSHALLVSAGCPLDEVSLSILNQLFRVFMFNTYDNVQKYADTCSFL